MQSPLMSTQRRKRLTITEQDGRRLISLGEMEIWDGADLALIRDTLSEQIVDFGRRDLALDMKTVKYIPSGFFGMLGDWKDRGVNIAVYGVQENVGRMLWFQQFFTELHPGCFRLEAEPKFSMDVKFRDDKADPLVFEDDSDTLDSDTLEVPAWNREEMEAAVTC